MDDAEEIPLVAPLKPSLVSFQGWPEDAKVRVGAVEKTIKVGVSHEVLNRPDGLPGLTKAYDLNFANARGMEHGLAYQAIASGEIDLIDAFSTDGELLRYKLKGLQDDRGFFPPYHAAPMVRMETLKKHPEIAPVLE